MLARATPFLLPSLLSCSIVAGGSWLLRGGESGEPGAAAFAPSVVPMPFASVTSEEADPDTSRARVHAQIAMFDARFAAEPVNAHWALNEERFFNEFFSDTALRAQGLTPPQHLETTCHSATCRINLRYTDPLAAEQVMQQLALRVANQFPYGAILPLAQDDGSIEIDAWYSTKRI